MSKPYNHQTIDRRTFIGALFTLPAAARVLGAGPSALLASPPHSAKEVPYVIFEDDFDSDSDGPAALCMLLELEAAGECKIIACGTSETQAYATATMAATLHYFGRGDIPLGAYRDDLRPIDPDKSDIYDKPLFSQYMAADEFNYGHTRRHFRDYPDAVEVYVKALNSLPPGAKAKLIIGGGQTNLGELLKDHPDVIRARVSELHFMGGMIPPDAPEEQWHRDSNLTNTAPFHTKYVAENWPHDIPMYIADTYLGLRVPFMRPALRAQLSDLHPANRIHLLYRLWWDRPHGNALDLMSVITAVRGFTNLNGVDLMKQRGTLEVHPTTGLHRFISSLDGPHTLLRRPVDGDEGIKLADYIDDILLLRGGDAGDGVFRDEFTAERGSGSSETLQDRRGWTKAGAANSATLIDASSGDLYDEKARCVQFNGNSSTSPYNVQVKDFGSNDIRVRARVMVTQPDGYVGLCVRSDAGDNALGLNLRIQPGSRGLRLYNNDSPLAQTRTLEPAHEFILHTWYTIDLQVKGDQLIGRLCSDYNGRTLWEQVEVTLPSIDDRRYAGLIARDKGERASWFQKGVRQPVEFPK
jgi:purine nucleosidase